MVMCRAHRRRSSIAAVTAVVWVVVLMDNSPLARCAPSWHKERYALMFIKTFIIARDGCEPQSFHHGKMDTITRWRATATHLPTHLVDVSGRNRFQDHQILQRLNERVKLRHKGLDDIRMVLQILYSN